MGQVVAIQDIPGILYQAGFRGTALINALAVALAEGGYTGRDNVNQGVGGVGGSVDRGLFQINSFYHSEVTDSCAADPVCNAQAAFNISKGGTDFTQWATWTGGQAQAAVGRAQNIFGSWLATAGNAAGIGSTILKGGIPGTPVPDPTTSAGQGIIQQVTQPIVNAVSGGSALDLSGSINALGQTIARVPNALTAPFVDFINNLQALGAFLGQPNLTKRALLLAGGVVVSIAGLILFSLSFVPKSAVSTVAKAV